MKNCKNVVLFILFVGMIHSCTQPANWNQYLGPHRNAAISGTELLKEWPKNGPEELWFFPLGEGYGGAAIFDNEVFILDRTKGESDILRCIDLNLGEELWNYSYDAKGEISFPGSRTVPTVDKDYIWSVGPRGDM